MKWTTATQYDRDRYAANVGTGPGADNRSRHFRHSGPPCKPMTEDDWRCSRWWGKYAVEAMRVKFSLPTASTRNMDAAWLRAMEFLA